MPGPKRGERAKTNKSKMGVGGNGRKKSTPKKITPKKPMKTEIASGGNGRMKKKGRG